MVNAVEMTSFEDAITPLMDGIYTNIMLLGELRSLFVEGICIQVRCEFFFKYRMERFNTDIIIMISFSAERMFEFMLLHIILK